MSSLVCIGCMFRMPGFRRTSTIKRLWKQRKTELDTFGAHNFLKQLSELELTTLLLAVESGGAQQTDCVLVPNESVVTINGAISPHVLFCKLWRWPDLWQNAPLRRLPECKSSGNMKTVCINPHHWSQLCVPDSPPPPYKQFCADRNAEASALNPVWRMERYSLGSTETCDPYRSFSGRDCADGEGQLGSASGQGHHHWCTIAYWEHGCRVGRQIQVYDSSINIFKQLPHQNGMCLDILYSEYPDVDETVKRTREKIGCGIVLSIDGDAVWVYNRSESAIFANSPTLEHVNTRTSTVVKVLPGHSLKVFDFEKSATMGRLDKADYVNGPYDPNSARISFMKGWGSCYTRQFITSCPCWLEILLARRSSPHR